MYRSLTFSIDRKFKIPGVFSESIRALKQVISHTFKAFEDVI